MKILDSPQRLLEAVPNIVLAAGFFDGVHLGHRRILATTLERARKSGVEAWALTFDPHPLAIVAPGNQPPLLTRRELRLELLNQSGLDGCLLMPFTESLAALSPEAFVTAVLGGWMQSGHHCVVVSGNNWRFGHDRRGDLADIATISRGAIDVLQVPIVEYTGRRVSSSAIRAAISQGHVVEAHAMLGRPHWVRERTVSGRGLGSKIGFATANMFPTAEVLPPPGVYAVAVSRRFHAPQIWMKGVANLGFSPTVDTATNPPLRLEVHILGFSGTLHGEELDVHFLRRLRGEQKFPSLEALTEQIRRDVAEVDNLD